MSKPIMQMPQFEKLSGTENFPIWKAQMSAYLTVIKVIDIVDGKQEKPDDNDVNNMSKWITDDATAKLAILTAIDASQLDFVSSAESAAVMWKNLLTVYERSDPTSKTNALRDFHRYSYDGSSMAKHLTRIDNLAAKCKLVGEEISEPNVIAKILDGLPDRFDAVVTTWDIVPGKDQTRSNLKTMLLAAENRKSVTAESEQVLTIAKKLESKPKFNKKKEERKKKSKTDRPCWSCGKTGHYRRNCPDVPKDDKSGDGGRSSKGTSSANAATGSANAACFSVTRCSEVVDSEWIADSGASCHMAKDRSWFMDLKNDKSNLILANDGQLKAEGVGSVAIERWTGTRWECGKLLNVLFVPGLRKNLFSVGATASLGVTSKTANGLMRFFRDGVQELEAEQTDNNLFAMKIRRPVINELNAVVEVKRWHERLGHPGITRMRELAKSGLVPDLKLEEIDKFFCEPCQFGKMVRKPISSADKIERLPGEKIHSDVCGFMNHTPFGGSRYFVTFKDEATGFRFVFFLKHKDEVYEKFVKVFNRIQNHFGRPIKILFTDNGTELPCSKTPDSTPFDQWFKKSPTLTHVRTFGSVTYEHVADSQRRKWDSKAKKRILVGYDSESNHYRLFDIKFKKITTSINVTFNENDGTPSLNVNKWPVIEVMPETETTPEQEIIPNGGVRPAEEQAVDIRPAEEEDRRQLRNRSELRPPDFYQAHCVELDEPKTYAEAIVRPDGTLWQKAVDEGLESLTKNETWCDADLPPDRRAISAKWVFKLKRGPSGRVVRYKARLVACGYAQQPNIDFTETYSPVVRYESVRALLAIAAQQDMEIAQGDVKTAFLYGTLDEEIYMVLPDGAPNTGRVVKLIRLLYGLKQSPRQWNKRFVKFLTTFTFEVSNADRCVMRGEIDGQLVLLAIYVDDLLCMSKSKTAVDKVMAHLMTEFEITIGSTEYFVGFKIKRDRSKKTIKISQCNYLLRVAEKFGMMDAKGISTPAESHMYLSKSMAPEDDDGKQAMAKIPFREAVGSLMFAACVSRPDIMFAVSVVSRYLENPGPEHWQAVKRIIRYAKETATYGIVYDGQNTNGLIVYSDSDYASDPDTRRSTSGYITVLAGGAVSWMSQRQRIVTLSTTEAEYVAACDATKEAIWIQRFLKSVGVNEKGPTEMRLDNQGSIKLVKNLEFHKRTKHIDVRFHFIREVYENGQVDIKYVPSSKQLADILTKALPKNSFEANRAGLQIMVVATDHSMVSLQ
ncbi:retroelement pol polyprotein [Lasius niger]|uniref:Retroelement pol polyprotein n=1 Tax=Lasius niger TaxID=67767 RepID=A0A0J7KA47_LASNI|nr:retroelement pol polyprotein [Lasius niger]